MKKTILLMAIILSISAILIAQDWGSGRPRTEPTPVTPPPPQETEVTIESSSPAVLFSQDDFTNAAKRNVAKLLRYIHNATEGNRPRIAIADIYAPEYDFTFRFWAKSTLENILLTSGSQVAMLGLNQVDLDTVTNAEQTNAETMDLDDDAKVQYVIFVAIGNTTDGAQLRLTMVSVPDNKVFVTSAHNTIDKK